MNDDQIIMNLEDELKKLEQERDEAQALAEEYRLKLPTTAQAMAYQSLLNKYDEARAKCAEMREIIHTVYDMDELGRILGDNDSPPDPDSLQQKVQHALSADCGKGYIPVSELEQTKDVLIECIHALICSDGEEQPRARELANSELARLQALKEGK